MRRLSGPDILTQLNGFMELARSLSLNPSAGRFRTYQERIEHYLAAHERSKSTGEFSYLRDEETELDYITALTRAVLVGDALEYLKICDTTILRNKLEIALKGPDLAKDENARSSSNRARNIAFELYLGANLWRAGLRPRQGEHPDIMCNVDDRDIYIECKRPLSSEGLQQGINEAKRQFSRCRKGAPPGTRGVIAVDITRMLYDPTMLLRAPGENLSRDRLKKELEATGKGAFVKLGGLTPRRLIGGLFYAMTPIWSQEERKFVVGQYSVAQDLAPEGTTDWRVFSEFYKALKRIEF